GLQPQFFDFRFDLRAGSHDERTGRDLRIAGLRRLLGGFELEVLQPVAQRDEIVRAVVQNDGDRTRAFDVAIHRQLLTYRLDGYLENAIVGDLFHFGVTHQAHGPGSV